MNDDPDVQACIENSAAGQGACGTCARCRKAARASNSMAPPDPRVLVAQAQQEAGRREGDEDLASLLHDLADALSAALGRIAALTAPVDDARVGEIEERLAKATPVRDEEDAWTVYPPYPWWMAELRSSAIPLADVSLVCCAPADLAYLLDRVRALTAEVVAEREKNALLRMKTCDHTFEGNYGMFDTMWRYCTKCGVAE